MRYSALGTTLTKNSSRLIKQMSSEAIATIVGALIAGLIGLIVSRWQRQRDGRDRFLAVIGEMQSELDECGNVDDRAIIFHARSLVHLRSAVFAIQPFISNRRYGRLLKLWRDYKNLTEQVATRPAIVKRIAHELTHGKGSPTMPLYPDELLSSYLNKFRKEICWYDKIF